MNDLIAQKATTPAQMALRLAKLKEIKAEVDRELKEINTSLLESMKTLGVLNLKTEELTITRSTRVTPKVTILEDLRGYFVENGLEFSTKQVPDDVTMNTVKQMVKDGKTPDGVEAQVTEYVSVRVGKSSQQSRKDTYGTTKNI